MVRTAAAALLWAAAQVATAPGAVEDFEVSRTPLGWAAGAGGRASVTSVRFKSGGHSLCWTWPQPHAALTVAAPGTSVRASAGRSLGFWLYNEQAREQVLRLELLCDGKVVGRCWYALNFTGWRPLGAPYAQLCPQPQTTSSRPAPGLTVDALRLIAPAPPAGADAPGGGRLFIDYVNFACADKLRPDNQQPWVGRPDILNAAEPLRFIYSSRDLSRNRPWLPKLVGADQITADQRRGMEIILSRCLSGDEAFGIGPIIPPAYPSRKDPTVLEDFEKHYRIQRSADGVLTGRPLAAQAGGFNVPPGAAVLHLFDPRLQPQHPEAMMMNRLVEAYRFEADKGGAARAGKLRDAFFDLCDHLLDQGFAEGNANCASWCFHHRMVFAMRDELARSGRLSDMLLAALACATSYGDGVLAVEDWRRQDILGDPRNTDGFRNYLELLALVALLPDASQRLQRLEALSRAVSLLCDEQLGEPYAWDGTCHHHALFHPAYSYGALMPMAFALRDTCFGLSGRAIAALKRSYMAMAFMANAKGIIPPNCPGYAGQPLGIYSDIAIESPLLSHRKSALLLAYCNAPDDGGAVDRDLAGIYLAFHEDNPDPPRRVRELRGKGIAPHRPTGHLTLNGASIALHRRDDWLVCIAGQNRFRRSLEANGTYCASAYNHYVRNGSVFVVSQGAPPCPFSSGFGLEGWDSRLIPGATVYLGQSPDVWFDARVRPGGPLRDPLAFWGRTGRNESPSGGGTSLDGDGVWGMEFIHDHPLFADNLRFYRSAFCFGGRVTLVTTGIARTANAGAGECGLTIATTLWQNAFGSHGRLIDRTGKERHLAFGWNVPMKPAPTPPSQEPCWVEGERITALPWSRTLPPGPPRWLIDNKQTGYYLHANSPPLHLARREQTWTFGGAGFARDPAVTRGNFAVAWLDHGAKPDATECAYTLIPQATPEAMADFALDMSGDDPPYLILQKDARAHVLRDRDTRTTGYLVFSKEWSPAGPGRPTAGALLAVNRPCSVMIRPSGQGLRLSAASTDMDSWFREIVLSGEIVLTLSGRWKPAAGEAEARHEGAKTILRIPFRTFNPVVLALQPAWPGL